MRDDDRLEELPEAVPLHRVAPFWRLIAIVAIIATVGLLLLIPIVGIALVEALNRRTAVVPAFAPVPPAVAMAPGVAFGTAVQDDAPADTQNLPYPVSADLAEREPGEPGAANEPPAAKPSTARQRFLDIGTDMCKLKGHLPDQLAISPDGEHLAYVVDGNLIAGPIGSQKPIVGTVAQQMAVPTYTGKGRRLAYAPVAVMVPESNPKVGPVSWVPDNRFVYCADSKGHLVRYDLQGGRPDGLENAQVLPFDGEWPAPVPGESEELVFVRSQPRPKLDLSGKPPLDPLEIVLGNVSTKEVRVLVPASDSAWRHLSVSPDGKRLALVSDRGHEGERSRHLRVFVLDLPGGEPMPLSPPASQVGPICWTADGQTMIYARSQEPAPPDYWEDEPAGPNGPLDLYQYELATNRETRLSRGGGCFSPSTNSSGDLYYLALQGRGSELLLRRVTLTAAREFTAREPEGIIRDAAAWTRFLNDVLQDSQVSAKLDTTAPTPEVLAKLAETFKRLYHTHFQAAPPAAFRALERQRRELQKLNLAPDVYPALTLILGAAEGDYFVRQHGARWHLTKGPLLLSAESAPESAFAYLANPFAAVNDWARHSAHGTAADGTPASLLGRAEGRTVVLTNDPAAASAIVAELTDSGLSRAMELLQQGKAESAEQAFQSLLKQKRHEQNLHLALRIGGLLYEAKRLPALQKLMEDQCDHLPRDPRKFNLLGLALLESEPRQAVDAFKNALRCDLRFEPAYLNLAQAYQLMNDPQSARMCLERYLAFIPGGVYAADARRRLAAVDTTGR